MNHHHYHLQRFLFAFARLAAGTGGSSTGGTNGIQSKHLVCRRGFPAVAFSPGACFGSFQAEDMAKRLNALTDGLRTFEDSGCCCVGTCLQVLHFLEPRSQFGKGNVRIRLTFLHGPRRTTWQLIIQRPSRSNVGARCHWRGLARHWRTRGYAWSARVRKITSVWPARGAISVLRNAPMGAR